MSRTLAGTCIAGAAIGAAGSETDRCDRGRRRAERLLLVARMLRPRSEQAERSLRPDGDKEVRTLPAGKGDALSEPGLRVRLPWATSPRGPSGWRPRGR